VIRQGLTAGQSVVVDGGDKLELGSVVVTHASNPNGSSNGGNGDTGLHP